MKSTPSALIQKEASQDFPGAAALAALRAWYAGMGTAEAVAQYLPHSTGTGRSSRAVLGEIRRQLADHARRCRRDDLAQRLMHSASERPKHARAVLAAIEVLRGLAVPRPLVTDAIEHWLPARIAKPLRTHGLRTLADLTVRVPRRRRWWVSIPGLGATGARQVEVFFAAHPSLTAAARALVPVGMPQDVVPWERLYVPHEVDGSRGAFRAPLETCILGARNDYEAVQAWLSLHESVATQRAYRKEAERLILWAIVERGKALSSLTTEDAVAYRAFLRHPAPRGRWVGPAAPRSSSEWRPFTGALSARSVAYALSVAGALFRWLIQQRYALANPFAGIKVWGASRSEPLAVTRVFGEGEWAILQAVAEGLEWVHGWEAPAAHRLRFVLDFAYATGLRIGELVGATLGQIDTDVHGDHWLRLVGKGGKAGKVALPPLARSALDWYLMQRQLPITPARWDPKVPLVGSLELDSSAGITATRLWSVMRRFFLQVAEVIEADSPALAEKLRHASPHWMRHTHATHALARGAELTTVRDNLRHASITTTSIYLHGDEVKRARQMDAAFAARGPDS
ncbi:site-specific recombinase XerD [Variovorax sp. SG517]|uniref:phage integrase family protein n=1 Tax=Variovorax sp. SG517 TaxID=2587117 RepID=UPI00159DD207|nr:phage integrase family protein [Variovorax sp. SG517]NVM89662.1 site-specific recombinase XerD [Variovorax sp. SG517]